MQKFVWRACVYLAHACVPDCRNFKSFRLIKIRPTYKVAYSMNRNSGQQHVGKWRPISHFLERKGMGNVTEGQGYADKRKKKILNTYKKLVRKNKPTIDLIDTPGQKVKVDIPGEEPACESDDTKEVDKSWQMKSTTHFSKNKERQKRSNRYSRSKETSHRKESQDKRNRSKITSSLNRYSSAEQQHQRETEDYQKRIKEKNAKQEAKEAALKRYQEKKQARHQKLRRKTRKGQPIIKYHMDHLLQKIQSQNL